MSEEPKRFTALFEALADAHQPKTVTEPVIDTPRSTRAGNDRAREGPKKNSRPDTDRVLPDPDQPSGPPGLERPSRGEDRPQGR